MAGTRTFSVTHGPDGRLLTKIKADCFNVPYDHLLMFWDVEYDKKGRVTSEIRVASFRHWNNVIEDKAFGA